MDMTQTDQPGATAINSYIGRVDAAARDLPPDRRVELLDQLRTRRAVPPARGTALHAPARSVWGPLEIIAVLLLIVGTFLIPVVGPLAGLVCAWFSRAWTRGEKLVATLLCSGPILLVGTILFSTFF